MACLHSANVAAEWTFLLDVTKTRQHLSSSWTGEKRRSWIDREYQKSQRALIGVIVENYSKYRLTDPQAKDVSRSIKDGKSKMSHDVLARTNDLGGVEPGNYTKGPYTYDIRTEGDVKDISILQNFSVRQG